jgi:hypothetical protein
MVTVLFVLLLLALLALMLLFAALIGMLYQYAVDFSALAGLANLYADGMRRQAALIKPRRIGEGGA